MESTRKKPTLTKTQRAILLKLKGSTALFEKYQAAVREFVKAEKVVAKARETLKKIEPMHAAALAEADPEAAEVFHGLGMLPTPGMEPGTWPISEVTTPSNVPSLVD